MNITEAFLQDLSDLVESVSQVALYDGQNEVSYEGYTRISTKLNVIKDGEGIAIVNEEEIYFKNIGYSSNNFYVVLMNKDGKHRFSFKILRQVNKGDGILFRKNQFMYTLD